MLYSFLMSAEKFTVQKATSLTRVARSGSFSVAFFQNEQRPTSDVYSRAYITLKDGRDPEHPDKASQLAAGFSADYTGVNGELVFTFYDNIQPTKVSLGEKDTISVKPGVAYDITGTGEAEVICVPPITNETFLQVDHPRR